MQYQKIWDKTLSSDEKVEYEFSIGERYLNFILIMIGIISLPLLAAAGFGIVTFLIALFYCKFYAKTSNAYAFTNKRIIIHTGWLSTKMVSVDYTKITDMHVEEPIVDRIFTHTGNLSINTAGSGNIEIVLRHIEKPYEVKKKLDVIMAK